MGDNIIEYTETTTKNNQYPPLTSSRKGIFLQTEYFAGNQIASDDNTGYNIVPYGYFTYRHMSDDEIFHFNINDIVENGIVSTLYPVFTTDENLDSRYLQYQLNYGYEFAKFAILQKQGGSRTYMYLNKLKQLYLTMPKSVEEQNAISAFFMSLDHLITLHQRKCDELQKLKKFMLQNMFTNIGNGKSHLFYDMDFIKKDKYPTGHRHEIRYKKRSFLRRMLQHIKRCCEKMSKINVSIQKKLL